MFTRRGFIGGVAALMPASITRLLSVKGDDLYWIHDVKNVNEIRITLREDGRWDWRVTVDHNDVLSGVVHGSGGAGLGFTDGKRSIEIRFNTLAVAVMNEMGSPDPKDWRSEIRPGEVICADDVVRNMGAWQCPLDAIY